MATQAFTEVLTSRQEMLRYLKNELIGPLGGENEVLAEDPFQRYTAGILYPQGVETEVIIAEENQDEAGVTGATTTSTSGEEQGDEPVYLSNQYLPASMGLSFYLAGDDPSLEIKIDAAKYRKTVETKKRGGIFRREPVRQSITVRPGDNLSVRKKVLGDSALLVVVWRKGENGYLVTVSLVNLAVTDRGERINSEACLCQVEIQCSSAGTGRIASYPHVQLLTDDREEHEMDLLYRNYQSFGVGHGCSVSWSQPSDGVVDQIRSDFLPSVTIPDITFSLDQDFDRVQSLYYLAEGENYKDDLIRELGRFIQAYQYWIGSLENENDNISQDLQVVKTAILERLNATCQRMLGGLRLLEHDPMVLKAFCLSNRAMLIQYIHSQDGLAGRRHKIRDVEVEIPDLKKSQDRKWRPFQLAFQLLTISSVAFPEDPDRDVVDLIWFPTGGGKTDAYLSVAAFLVFYRRLKYRTLGGGTAIIMRYTLRLLTAQQFERASTLLCACEFIRRSDPELLGDEEISIGLWIGEDTPNTYQTASEKFEALLKSDETGNPFQIDRCPWCGTELIPRFYTPDPDRYGFAATNRSFSIHCPSPGCPFHDRLPVAVVDDQIYDNPPSLLLATVDKFARMTWVEKAGEIFGGSRYRPPELIIQDELHLINGPLGTIAGVYEIAIEALCARKGTPPKIISSTATIRRATEQVSGLYNRRLQLFPPSGLDASNSYFARYDKDKPGRMYVGFMGQGHTGSTSMIRVSAALLQAPIELGLKDQSLDAYWTLVAYHNSLRELGKTLTFASDDIPARIKVIAGNEEILRETGDDRTQELKSGIYNLKEKLNRLKMTPGERDAVAFLVCTNMFSVGVDVQRLGLMLINGQPKSTSEYIQASSRVGRKYPGLIVTLLSPTKPRDRSHYERFVSFHQALYRYVEPGSVTPFSPPARDRALHAVLVTIVRHALGLSANEDAASFRSDLDGLENVVDFICDRVQAVDESEAKDTHKRLEDMISEWEALAQGEIRLFYNNDHRAFNTLLVDAGSGKGKGWETLHSMRNVDRSCVVQIKRRMDRD